VTRLRADAQRNLGRVLEAAAEAFAEHGPDVSVDEIARRAGVGHATVFRRFPTKDALIVAVLRDRLGELAALAREALADDDPGAAFTGFVDALVAIYARDRGLYECFDRCQKEEEAQELDDLMRQIVTRAQEAGSVRRDIDAAEVPKLIGAAFHAARGGNPRAHVDVVLDGLRAVS
jgi:AcrR family transcriptional regulator